MSVKLINSSISSRISEGPRSIAFLVLMVCSSGTRPTRPFQTDSCWITIVFMMLSSSQISLTISRRPAALWIDIQSSCSFYCTEILALSVSDFLGAAEGGLESTLEGRILLWFFFRSTLATKLLNKAFSWSACWGSSVNKKKIEIYGEILSYCFSYRVRKYLKRWFLTSSFCFRMQSYIRIKQGFGFIFSVLNVACRFEVWWHVCHCKSRCLLGVSCFFLQDTRSVFPSRSSREFNAGIYNQPSQFEGISGQRRASSLLWLLFEMLHNSFHHWISDPAAAGRKAWYDCFYWSH